jgi:hypothetical protein
VSFDCRTLRQCDQKDVREVVRMRCIAFGRVVCQVKQIMTKWQDKAQGRRMIIELSASKTTCSPSNVPQPLTNSNVRLCKSTISTGSIKMKSRLQLPFVSLPLLNQDRLGGGYKVCLGHDWFQGLRLPSH